MTGRVSNKQILSALNDLPTAIAAAIAGNTVASPVISESPIAADATPETADSINVDGGYLSHVTTKLQARANDTKKTYVLYARVNKANETKLAYCEADKWSTLTDKRIVGAVSTVAPE